jgi:hypothetical protein
MQAWNLYVVPRLGIPFVYALPSIEIIQSIRINYQALLFSSFNLSLLEKKSSVLCGRKSILYSVKTIVNKQLFFAYHNI